MNAYLNHFKSNLIALGKAFQFIPEHVLETAQVKNPWFTVENIKKASASWSKSLQEPEIEKWISSFKSTDSEKNIGIIMAGNIPFVGLHDLLCVLAKGHKATVKLSSNDEVLMSYIIMILKQFQEELNDKIIVSDSMKNIDGLIATGSNNTSRYFELYFKNIPHIIRKSRTSIAVLSGNETDEELVQLSDDIYTFFGLGCRNVTHLIFPESFELRRIYEAFDKYIDIVNHHKYYNNYMYHKSILLMNLSKHYDNGFMLFQNKNELHAPIATMNYHTYLNLSEVQDYIESHQNELQCVVSNIHEIKNAIALGQSQQPALTDYADHINTIEFLEKI